MGTEVPPKLPLNPHGRAWPPNLWAPRRHGCNSSWPQPFDHTQRGLGSRASIPPQLHRRETALGCGVRRQPGALHALGYGTHGRALRRQGSGVRAHLLTLAPSQARQPSAHRGSPRGPPPRPPGREARQPQAAPGSPPTALSVPPTPPHLRWPSPVQPCESAFPLLQPRANARKPFHGCQVRS